MPTQLREASAHHHLQMVGRTLGNEGRADCLKASVQRPNVINVNGDRPTMSNIRQPQRHTGIAGGEHYTRPSHNEREQDPSGGRASRGQPNEYNDNMTRMANTWQPNRLAKQLHIIAKKLELRHCYDCKIKATQHNFVIFQFDHLDRKTKVAKIANMVKGKYTINDIDNEIAKCQMVCGNCHALRTYYRRDHDQLKEPKAEQPRLFDE